MTIDKRKNYYLTIDTETAGGLDSPLVYDIGGSIHDKKGNILESFSFVVQEIFFKQEIMETAYYKDKIDIYVKDINEGKRIIKKWFDIKKYINYLAKKYNIKAIIAHNAYFDYNAIKNTTLFLTNGEKKYFLPYGVPIWDSLKMVRDTIGKQPSYKKYCEKHGFMTNHAIPRPQLKAEILYRYITGETNFIESHTGLEDVKIEVKITSHCFRQHKKMRKELWVSKD